TLVSFDPTPTYENVTSACYPSISTNRGEYLLTNAGDYRTHVASVILTKNFDAGLFTPGGSSYFTLGYAYTNAHDRRNMYNSTAGSNFNATAVFDRQNPDPSRAFYETRHNITFSGNVTRLDLCRSLGPSIQPDLFGRRQRLTAVQRRPEQQRQWQPRLSAEQHDRPEPL